LSEAVSWHAGILEQPAAGSEEPAESGPGIERASGLGHDFHRGPETLDTGISMRLFEGTPFDRPPRCERCDELEDECTCPPPQKEPLTPQTRTARIVVEKRKRGKVVTVVRGLIEREDELPQLLSKLKAVCGAGGTLDGAVLEIQGNQVEKVRSTMAGLGYRVAVKS
jgi:translation initiation factor 1